MAENSRAELQRHIQEIHEEAEGDRGEYYELYGSGIRDVLSPLARLLDASLEQHPELVELTVIALRQSNATSRVAELEDLLVSAKETEEEPSKLWRFYWDAGRQGTVDSVFVATQSEIDAILGKEIYFGEILGKHSDIYGVIEEGDIELISSDPELVAIFRTNVGSTGHNPLDYLEAE